MSEREDALMAEIVIGDDARRFLESELGRTVLGIAEREKQAALVALSTTDPEDTKSIRAHQTTIWRVDSFASWLAELIQHGREAEDILRDEAEIE